MSYTPAHQKADDLRNRMRAACNTCEVSLETLLQMPERSLIRQLRKSGHLYTHATRTHCNNGNLTQLRMKPGGERWAQRCRATGCRKLVFLHSGHPVFKVGSGAASMPLKRQAACRFIAA